jgi:hypothetical protein
MITPVSKQQKPMHAVTYPTVLSSMTRGALSGLLAASSSARSLASTWNVTTTQRKETHKDNENFVMGKQKKKAEKLRTSAH